jgi:hypothetical protein
MSDYNGWTNRETWLVNLWYMDDMPYYFTTIDQYHVEPNELEEAVISTCETLERITNLACGLVSDFLSGCWSHVNWHELADALNETLKEMEEENDK